MFRSIKSVRTCALAAIVTALSACGGSGPDSVPGATTTMGTRTSLSQANPAITANANGAWKDYSRDTDYPGVAVDPLQFITLSSGQKLGVLVGRPADANGKPIDGRFPVILTQTAYRIDVGQTMSELLPYGSTLVIGGADPYLVKRGYIIVSVDVLGSGVSDGEEYLLGSDEQEAYGETVNWVTQQPWFDGNLGLAGTSYLGITSLLTAEQGNPAVKAVFVDVPMGDSYRGVIGTGGMLNGLFLSWWLNLTQGLSVANSAEEKKYPQYAAQIEAATQQHIATINDFFIPMIQNGLNGVSGYATDDGDFWAVRSPIENAKNITVPTFIIGANHDIFQRDEPLLYEQIKNNVNAKLLIVPGEHVESVTAALGNSGKASDGGVPSSEHLLLQWFDQYLKGMDNSVETLPNVTQYVIGYGDDGNGNYASASDWPNPLTTVERWYLHGDMSLSTDAPAAGEGTHTVKEPAAPEVSVTASSDGTHLKMTAVSHDDSKHSISYDQWTLGLTGLVPHADFKDDARVEKSQKALLFDTAPMAQDFYINGPIEADIWMSTDAGEAAVSVRVDDVSADGKTVTPLSNGLLAAGYRAVDTSRSRYIDGQMIQPWHPFTADSMLPVNKDEPMLLPVEIFPTAALIRAGHVLRIAISASNQSQGGWSLPLQAKADRGVSTIYNDADHPSSVVLPVVPASVLN